MEDTPTQTKEEKALIEELIREVEAAPVGGKPEVIFKGDETLPAPMVASKIYPGGDKGKVYIYDTKTGERSVALGYMLRELLKAKNPDGSTRFTTRKPSFSPKLGTHKCMLHPDNPNRAHYDELGFPTCRKSNLTSPYMVKKHMKSRHKVEFEAIEEERKDREKKEDRDFQRSIISRTVPPVEEKAPLYVSAKDQKKTKIK